MVPGQANAARDREVRYDRATESMVFGERQRTLRSDWGLVLHRSDLAGISATQFCRELRRAQKDPYSVPVDTIPVTQSAAENFDPEYAICTEVQFKFDGERLGIGLDFFRSEYDDELTTSDVEQELEPLLRRHHFALTSLSIDDSYMSGPPWLWHVTFAFSTRGKTLCGLYAAAEEISAFFGATESGSLTAAAARDLVLAGNAEALIGQVESHWLEAKTEPYKLMHLEGKISFAESVARFANADGGLIIFGVRTHMRGGREVLGVLKPFPVAPKVVRQHRQALANHLYPPPNGLSCEVVVAEDFDGYLVVYVPQQPEEMKPFLVHGAVADGKTRGAYISIVTRVGDDSVPTTAPMIHATLAAGRALLRRGELPRVN